jgi:hypothetical protein
MKQLYLLPVLLLALAACRKNNSTDLGPAGCITQHQKDYFNLKASDSLQAIKLFQQNNIKYNNLVLERLIMNDTITNTEGTHIYNHVVIIQYVNGLPILSGDAGYHFRDGVFQQTSGIIYTSVNLDTHSTLSLPKLSKLYMDEAVNKQGYNAGFRDSCLVAQFGYFNLNAGSGDNTTKFVKAWRITMKDWFYPVAYYRDDNAQLISFDSGIRTLN